MDLIITILPVVTKDLPISPRFTPYNFLSRYKFSTLTTRQPMVELYLLTFPRSHAFRYERKNTNLTLVRIELTTSANEQRARGGGGGALPDFFLFLFFPVQQTTSGIGHRVK